MKKRKGISTICTRESLRTGYEEARMKILAKIRTEFQVEIS